MKKLDDLNIILLFNSLFEKLLKYQNNNFKVFIKTIKVGEYR